MKKLLVCTHYRANPNQPSCAARGSKTLANTLAQLVKDESLEMVVETSNCLGYCAIGINLKLSPNGDFIHHITESPNNKLALVGLIREFVAK